MDKYRRYISALILAYVNISFSSDRDDNDSGGITSKPPDEKDNKQTLMIISFIPGLCYKMPQ